MKRYRAIMIDANLLAQAEAGNRAAIRTLAEEAAAHIRVLAAQAGLDRDDLTPFLLRAIEVIAAGQNPEKKPKETPDKAFGWNRKRSRQRENLSLLRWNMGAHVEALILERGMTERDAIALVAKAANKGGDPSGTVARAYRDYAATDGAIPDDAFPYPPAVAKSIKKLDARVALLLANPS